MSQECVMEEISTIAELGWIRWDKVRKPKIEESLLLQEMEQLLN